MYPFTDLKVLLQLRNSSHDGVYMTYAQVIEYYNQQNFPQPEILKTKESIQMLPFSIFFRKHSCITNTFNRQIEAGTSSGLISFWADRLTKSHFKFNGKIKPKTLKFNQIKGILMICMCLYGFSIIIFFVELLSARHKRIKRFVDFFTYK